MPFERCSSSIMNGGKTIDNVEGRCSWVFELLSDLKNKAAAEKNIVCKI